MDLKAQANLHQRRSSIASRANSTQAVEFFNLLTSPELLQTTEALLPKHRERLYPPTVTLSMFIRQVLEADGSCQKAVNGSAACGRWFERLQRSRRWLLPGSPAAAPGDGQCAHAPNRLGWIAVGMPVTGHPPHRSQRAQLTHWAPTLGV
jgi:hypothetical protein